jgi:DNA-binding Xre family transcriptional regulator
MRHDKYVSMEVLVKLCRYFNCTLDDIVEIEKIEICVIRYVLQ